MIRCPECGQEAPDDARFCDRCGQGLTAGARPVATVEPLPPGTELAGAYRIVELLGRTSEENRYRAEVIGVIGEFRELRERLASSPAALDEAAGAKPEEAPTLADPSSSTAKTAELHLREQAVTANGAAETATPRGDGDAPATAAAPSDEGAVVLSVEAAADADEAPAHALESPGATENRAAEAVESVERAPEPMPAEDLGDVFGRVMALSLTLNHPAIRRAEKGFATGGRVYLVYPSSHLETLAQRLTARPLAEAEALALGIQLCQVVAYFHRHALRVNDLCPESVAFDDNGRLQLTGLDYVSNDNELQELPIFNDGYTAPEVYRARRVTKSADIFAIGAQLYTCLTGERLEAESWREEAGPVRFYPPHVLTPALEQLIRRAIRFEPEARFSNVDELKAELVKLAGTVAIRAAALTDVGMVRALNEDSVLALELRQQSLVRPETSLLYVVADGMGGAEAGEVASAIAVDAIRAYVDHHLAAGPDAQLPDLLREALEEANRKVLEYAAAHPEARGLGSTAVAALLAPPEAAIAWVGDSRAYQWRDGELRQLSKDHSLVQRLIEIGQITPEEARHHEHKNVITRSLGARATGPAGAESISMRLRRGDRLLLCSDGLTTHVEDGQIEEILRRNSDSESAALELVVAANAGGGTDNISVVVVTAH